MGYPGIYLKLLIWVRCEVNVPWGKFGSMSITKVDTYVTLFSVF